jgi:hypothetical protein
MEASDQFYVKAILSSGKTVVYRYTLYRKLDELHSLSGCYVEEEIFYLHAELLICVLVYLMVWIHVPNL